MLLLIPSNQSRAAPRWWNVSAGLDTGSKTVRPQATARLRISRQLSGVGHDTGKTLGRRHTNALKHFVNISALRLDMFPDDLHNIFF